MAKCPECNSPVGPNSATCSKCGCDLNALESQNVSETLDALKHFDPRLFDVESSLDSMESLEHLDDSSSIESIESSEVIADADIEAVKEAKENADQPIVASDADATIMSFDEEVQAEEEIVADPLQSAQIHRVDDADLDATMESAEDELILEPEIIDEFSSSDSDEVMLVSDDELSDDLDVIISDDEQDVPLLGLDDDEIKLQEDEDEEDVHVLSEAEENLEVENVDDDLIFGDEVEADEEVAEAEDAPVEAVDGTIVAFEDQDDVEYTDGTADTVAHADTGGEMVEAQQEPMPTIQEFVSNQNVAVTQDSEALLSTPADELAIEATIDSSEQSLAPPEVFDDSTIPVSANNQLDQADEWGTAATVESADFLFESENKTDVENIADVDGTVESADALLDIEEASAIEVPSASADDLLNDADQDWGTAATIDSAEAFASEDVASEGLASEADELFALDADEITDKTVEEGMPAGNDATFMLASDAAQLEDNSGTADTVDSAELYVAAQAATDPEATLDSSESVASPVATDNDATLIAAVNEEPVDAGTADTLDSADMFTPEAVASSEPKRPFNLGGDPSDVSGTVVNPEDQSKSGTAVTAFLSAKDLEDVDPMATVDSDPVGVAQGDDIGTVAIPQDRMSNVRNTAIYSETELKAALEGKGVSGTSGQMKRIWAGIAGSSNNPSHSLAVDEGLASDSVFRHVAVRRVAQANSPLDANADYTIIDKLGEGGMGIVYSARQMNVDRVVALKAIKANQQATDESRRKFFYEAQITADLDHPNIVPIYELGNSEDGLLFYSMKIVTGTEWKDVIKQKSREENLDILSKVSDAIAFAHSKGVIHRDLKPANTMLGTYGEVYVTDWGMAVDLKNKRRTFGPGGSPVYMAPEQASHSISKIGYASDIYLLGAILFQVISGSPPHPGRTVNECLRAAARNEIIPFESDDALLLIARKAMETDVKNRYASVEEFKDAIREYRQHAESVALSGRAEESLNKAMERKDYDLFSRSVFSYRDAVELWPENTAAVEGLKRAQSEYGKCAIAKGDFDLAMQVVDRQHPEQAALYDTAVKGKKAIEGREKRIKTMRRVVMAVVLAAFAVSSTLALVAWTQKRKAEFAQLQEAEQRQKAVANAEEARKQEELANINAAEAKEQEAKAKEQEAEAKKQEALAKENATKAQMQEQLAKENENTAKVNAQRAIASEQIAKENAAEALRQKSEADIQREKAQESAAVIQLGEFQSRLALSKAQLESFAIEAGQNGLLKTAEINEAVFDQYTPQFKTWPWYRVSLLSNQDLPGSKFNSPVTSMAFAKDASLGVLGTANGELHLMSLTDGQLKLAAAPQAEPAQKIVAVAISPKGDEIVYAFERPGSKFGLNVWSNPGTAQSKVLPVKAVENRSIQCVSYSPDGATLVAGLNQGVWLWQRKDKWYDEAKSSSKVTNIRGELSSLNWVGADSFLAASKNEDGLNLHLVQVGKDSSTAVKTPEGFSKRLSAIAYDAKNKQVILGTKSGQIFTAGLEKGSEITQLNELLPQKHVTEVRQIVMRDQSSMLTTSVEPVVQVWKLNAANNSWVYDTHLAGTPDNISKVAFDNSGKVVGADEKGNAKLWDIAVQKRNQLMVPTWKGNEAEYKVPIVGVFGANGDNALTVDANGAVSRWNLRDGSVTPIGDSRFSYVGHTPDSQYVDTAIDNEAGVVVTSAKLPPRSVYLNNVEHKWEYCVWDMQSGNMRRRWTAASDKAEPQNAKDKAATTGSGVEQRISLIDHGRALLTASDSETSLHTLDGQLLFRATDFGTYFASTHPTQPNLVMLVMRSGALRMLDLSNLKSWKDSPRDYSLTSVSDTPLQGVWSPKGDRYFLSFTSGAVAAIDWKNNKLDLRWSSHILDGQPGTKDLERALAQDAIRVRSHSDIDMGVNIQGNDCLLGIARRARGAGSTTELTVVKFAADNKVSLVQHEKPTGLHWLDTTGETPKLADNIEKGFRIDENQVYARHQSAGLTYITTGSANVIRLKQGDTAIQSFGNQKLVDVSGNQEGTQLLTLRSDGSIIQFKLNGSDGQWQRFAYEDQGLDKTKQRSLKLSTDGEKFVLVGANLQGQTVARIYNATSGTLIHEFEDVAAVAWDPVEKDSLAVCQRSGKIELWNGTAASTLPRTADVNGAGIVSVNFLLETWSKSKDSEPKASRRYLVVQTEDAKQGYLQFVPLSDDERKTKNVSQKTSINRGMKITTSPKEAVIVGGDNAGGVTVWCAMPYWDNQARELFQLEGHRGAEIKVVAFAQHGDTIVSTDSQNRVIGWLSRSAN